MKKKTERREEEKRERGEKEEKKEEEEEEKQEEKKEVQEGEEDDDDEELYEYEYDGINYYVTSLDNGEVYENTDGDYGKLVGHIKNKKLILL